MKNEIHWNANHGLNGTHDRGRVGVAGGDFPEPKTFIFLYLYLTSGEQAKVLNTNLASIFACH